VTEDRPSLHVTNGDAAAEALRLAGLPGEALPWRDVLHEGPVPAGLDPAALAEVRARFVAARGWSAYETVLADLTERDAALARAAADPAVEIVLWFEIDLYDQLQFLQVLDRLTTRRPAGASTAAVDVGALSGMDGFVGLGACDAGQIRRLYRTRRPVLEAAFSLGQAAWAAFTAADPAAIEALLASDTSALPELAAALRRHLEEFPATGDGLARSERQLLSALAGGARTPLEAFAVQRAGEARPFLGDTIAWDRLGDLGSCRHPLVAHPDQAALLPPGEAFVHQPLILTATGRAVLTGRVDRAALGGLDRWLGGVHLTGPTPAWRWDAAAGRLVAAQHP
jgi:hypothetical protein